MRGYRINGNRLEWSDNEEYLVENFIQYRGNIDKIVVRSDEQVFVFLLGEVYELNMEMGDFINKRIV